MALTGPVCRRSTLPRDVPLATASRSRRLGESRVRARVSFHPSWILRRPVAIWLNYPSLAHSPCGI